MSCLPPAGTQSAPDRVTVLYVLISYKICLFDINGTWTSVSYQIMWSITYLSVQCLTVSLQDPIKDTCCEGLSISLKSLAYQFNSVDLYSAKSQEDRLPLHVLLSQMEFLSSPVNRDHCSKLFFKTFLVHCFDICSAHLTPTDAESSIVLLYCSYFTSWAWTVVSEQYFYLYKPFQMSPEKTL